mmetsp:Transcript_30838/g.73450  ORF Transcript_30838/g.73450 Transcript_30838/m.73450 type:complete len:212 (-) Transcript_30838:1608-2243(-)
MGRALGKGSRFKFQIRFSVAHEKEGFGSEGEHPPRAELLEPLSQRRHRTRRGRSSCRGFPLPSQELSRERGPLALRSAVYRHSLDSVAAGSCLPPKAHGGPCEEHRAGQHHHRHLGQRPLLRLCLQLGASHPEARHRQLPRWGNGPEDRGEACPGRDPSLRHVRGGHRRCRRAPHRSVCMGWQALPHDGPGEGSAGEDLHRVRARPDALRC